MWPKHIRYNTKMESRGQILTIVLDLGFFNLNFSLTWPLHFRPRRLYIAFIIYCKELLKYMKFENDFPFLGLILMSWNSSNNSPWHLSWRWRFNFKWRVILPFHESSPFLFEFFYCLFLYCCSCVLFLLSYSSHLIQFLICYEFDSYSRA